MKSRYLIPVAGWLIFTSTLGYLGIETCRLSSIVQERDKEIMALKEDNSRAIKLEEKSLNNGRWYVMDLEGKVQPGNYDLRTEESDHCEIIADNVKVEKGNYQFMFIEKKTQSSSANQ